MEDGGLASLLALGFTLGLVHALDGDHVIAVTNLASQRPTLRVCLSLAGRWAIGHGAALMVLGGLAFALGLSIPPGFSRAAEWGVAALLFGLGGWILFDLQRARVRRRLHLHFHEHAGLPRHSHWHAHVPEQDHDAGADHRHGHAAVWVGVLHGAAGSAPLLAVIPALEQRSAAFGLGYLLLFCLGVAAGMLVFGGVLGSLSAPFVGAGRERALGWLRGLAAVGSIAVGVRIAWGLV